MTADYGMIGSQRTVGRAEPARGAAPGRHLSTQRMLRVPRALEDGATATSGLNSFAFYGGAISLGSNCPIARGPSFAGKPRDAGALSELQSPERSEKVLSVRERSKGNAMTFLNSGLAAIFYSAFHAKQKQ